MNVCTLHHSHLTGKLLGINSKVLLNDFITQSPQNRRHLSVTTTSIRCICGFVLLPCGRLSWLLPAFDRTLISHSYLLTYLPCYSSKLVASAEEAARGERLPLFLKAYARLSEQCNGRSMGRVSVLYSLAIISSLTLTALH